MKNNNQSREENAIDLNHENIVKIINIMKKEKNYYSMIFMEYYPNSVPLQRIIDYPSFDLTNKIITFSMDLCQGLNYCHKKKILHLDLKPSNILVCETTCKICDFGNSICEENLADFKHYVRKMFDKMFIVLEKN